VDTGDAVTVGGKDVNAIGPVASEARCRPQIAIDVAANTVASARGHVAKRTAVSRAHAINDIEQHDIAMMRSIVGTARVHHIEPAMVR
jgi:hypothetical protein